MTTREKKIKLNSDSPTPNAKSESPSTPNSQKVTAKRKPRKTRNEKTMNVDGASDNGEDDSDMDEMSSKEDLAKSPSKKSNDDTNKKDLKTPPKNDDAIAKTPTKAKATRVPTVRSPSKRKIKRTNSVDAASDSAVRTTRANVIATKTQTIRRRRSLPEGKQISNAVKKRNSTGIIKKLIKGELNETVDVVKKPRLKRGSNKLSTDESEEMVKPQPKKRRLLSVESKETRNKIVKLEDVLATVSDSELTKLRRNSDTPSKCSDTTEASSITDMISSQPSCKEEIENNNQEKDKVDGSIAATVKEIKIENVEKEESKSEIVAEPKSENVVVADAKIETTTAPADDDDDDDEEKFEKLELEDSLEETEQKDVVAESDKTDTKVKDEIKEVEDATKVTNVDEAKKVEEKVTEKVSMILSDPVEAEKAPENPLPNTATAESPVEMVSSPSNIENKVIKIEPASDENNSPSKTTKDKVPVRRSIRPRKTTNKDPDTPPSTPKSTRKTIVKTEPLTPTTTVATEEACNDDTSEVVAPLHIDTVSKAPAASTLLPKVEEKASSLSPQLESEGVSEMSVKKFYGEPAFRENNLGIEEDPKLGEIVQDKVTVDESSSLMTASAPKIVVSLPEEKVTTAVVNPIPVDKLVKSCSESSEIKSDENVIENELKDEIKKEIIHSEDDTKVKSDVEEKNNVDEALIVKSVVEVIAAENNAQNSRTIEKPSVDVAVVKVQIEVEKEIMEPIEKKIEAVKPAPEDDVKSDKPVEVVTPVVKPTKSVEILTLIEEIKQEKEDVSEAVADEAMAVDVVVPKQNTSVDPEQKTVSEPEKSATGPAPPCVIEPVSIDPLATPKAVIVKTSPEERQKSQEKIPEQNLISDNKENIVVKKSSSASSISDLKDVYETPESIKLKESHLKSLGLLTIQAADEAKIQKQRKKELLRATKLACSSSSSISSSSSSSGSSKTNGNAKSHRSSGGEYTASATALGQHHPDNHKRLPLKMTFQKGRGGKNVTGNERDQTAAGRKVEDTFYTIQNESESAMDSTSLGGQSRKTHSRSHTDGVPVPELEEILAPGEVKKDLVIPEKASSFKFHPGRLCRDQCFYCGGKFGLFDTPCHVAQIKSLERQKKILESEEKLTVDSCLCDACYRHVDRRANCPSYKKRLSAGQHSVGDTNDGLGGFSSKNAEDPLAQSAKLAICHVIGCEQSASHSLRRKWILRMKRSILKIIHINFDTSHHPAGMVPICDKHYDCISHLMVCSLCKRKLSRNHIFYITQEIPRIEKLLVVKGISVSLGATPVVCKLCRYFANLLLKPPEGKTQKAQFVKSYRRRLLQFHNVNTNKLEITDTVEIVDDDDDEEEPDNDVIISNPHSELPLPKKIVSTIKNIQQQQQLQKTPIAPPQLPTAATPTTNPPTPVEESLEGGHIMLDNDVMVDYDVPMMNAASPARVPTPQEKTRRNSGNNSGSKKRQNSNNDDDPNSEMARVLRANPNISMRELFPGEEEMGLHANIPLQHGKKMPDGWSKVTTVLQYDEVTKQMWEELQKPYGNQSSFLRHLVLLEKYFRNGDLILSQNASCSALTYSESVQTRLRSYDNIATGGMQIMQQQPSQQTSSAFNHMAPHVSITPAVSTKSKPKNVCETITTSLLKTNSMATQQHFMPSAALSSSSSQQQHQQQINKNRQISITNESKPQDILAAASKLMQVEEKMTSPGKKQAPHCAASGQPNIPPELISITKLQQQSKAAMMNSMQPTISNRKSPGPSTSAAAAMATAAANAAAVAAHKSANLQIIKLPDTLNPNERRQTNGKPWRPTLIPIKPDAIQMQQNGPLYQTVDGRRLPSLVQVLSGGKPYHISIHDYNRMCILRREKLIMQNQANMRQQKFEAAQKQAAENMKRLQIPNEILQQNSLIPVTAMSKAADAANNLKRRSAPNSLLKLNLNATSKVLSASNMLPTTIHNYSTNYASSATATITTTSSHQLSSSNKMLSIPPSSASLTITAAPPLLPPSIEMIKWNNISQENSVNGHNNSSSGGQFGQTSGGALILDNTAVSVLSKIPKSLTIIPQHKERARDDQMI